MGPDHLLPQNGTLYQLVVLEAYYLLLLLFKTLYQISSQLQLF